MRRFVLALAALTVAAPALAQEPVGCDKFKWPLDKERAMLASAVAVPASGALTAPLSSAFKVAMVRFDAASLPMPPTRSPKPGTTAGFASIPSLPKAGPYRITLSEAAWIDVFQDGKELKSTAFSGATGCDGVRKSVKFELGPTPFIVELSGAATNSISFVITPD